MWKHERTVIISIILAVLSYAAAAAARIIHVMEGDSTQLDFSFPCDSAQVTLRYGIRAPFYDSARPKSMSLPDHQELVVHNDPESYNCSIKLRFVHVLKKSDDGGYILTYYNREQIYQGDIRIRLKVDYPPDKAFCEWNEKNIANDWGSLLCQASEGSTLVNFVCYQNGVTLPPKDIRRQAGNLLQQMIWVRYSQAAFCCSFLQGTPVDRFACEDFVWDPLHSENIIDPCPDPLESTTPRSSEENSTTRSRIGITFLPTNQTTESTSEDEIAHQLLCWIPWFVSVALVCLVIVLCVVLQVKVRKIRKLETVHSDEYLESVASGSIQTATSRV